eukprot:4934681-Prymnesium_polylepis.2
MLAALLLGSFLHSISVPRKPAAKLSTRRHLALNLILTYQLIFSWRLIESWVLGVYRFTESLRHIKQGTFEGQTSIQQELQHYFANEPSAVAAACCATFLVLLQFHATVYCARLVHRFGRWREALADAKSQSGAVPIVCPCNRKKGADKHAEHADLERRVTFLTGRFARHAPRWQLAIWLRQFTLFIIAVTAKGLQVGSSADVAPCRYPFAVATITIVAVALALHHRVQPYKYIFQNTLETFLLGSIILLLVFGCIFTALPDRHAVVWEVSMILVMAGGWLGGAVYAIIELRNVDAIMKEADLQDAALGIAEDKIHKSLLKQLECGNIRLLRCRWLRQTQDTVMRRQQELLEEDNRKGNENKVFLSTKEAADLLRRGDRSVLVLSHRWLTAAHPEPMGTTTE